MLKLLPDKYVHTCVTSPPYFGLRDYGMPDQMGLEPTPDEFVAAALAAQKHGRKWIGCELNPEYIKIAQDRLV